MTSVLRPWVTNKLTLQMQGTLLTAIRGPDDEAKDSPSKPVVRAYRCVVLRNARKLGPDTSNTFAGNGTGLVAMEDLEQFFESIDQYPFHWFMHFLHSTEIVAAFHPNDSIAQHWNSFYLMVCDALHLNPESHLQLADRLKNNGHFETVGTPCPKCEHYQVFGPIAAGGRCSNCLALRYDLGDD